ncbi:M48 family metallopeptidase [Sulfitobacter sp. LCG007]
MIFKALAALVIVGLLSACSAAPGPVILTKPQPGQDGLERDGTKPLSASQAARNFVQVVRTVESVAESECRSRTFGVNCDFIIVVDDRRGQSANAYQTLDRSGRPVLAFTLGLIADARNPDEMAFVMSHEASHHILGHIARQQQNAIAGAVIAGSVAVLLGGAQADIETAKRSGAELGARTYSKDFELEADALGTVITARAGYDPIRGSEFFRRIPDPGDRFLGTHPPNAQRLEIVRRTAAGL